MQNIALAANWNVLTTKMTETEIKIKLQRMNTRTYTKITLVHSTLF